MSPQRCDKEENRKEHQKDGTKNWEGYYAPDKKTNSTMVENVTDYSLSLECPT